LIVCELTETELPDEFQIGSLDLDHPTIGPGAVRPSLTQKPEISWQDALISVGSAMPLTGPERKNCSKVSPDWLQAPSRHLGKPLPSLH